MLVCGGGPGIPQYLLEDQFPSALVEKFVVCYWDYRGTGLSYAKGQDPKMMTTDQYLLDVDKMTDYLRDRFGQEKIYILGHSFGTYMALKAVQAHPEKYEAYLAMSQICNQRESEYLAYDYMKATYQQKKEPKMVQELDKYSIKKDAKAYQEYFSSGLRDRAMHDLGIGTTRPMKSVINEIFLPSLKMKAYTQMERIHIWKAKMESKNFPVTKDAFEFNAFSEVLSIDLPIYFFAGRYDYTCSYSLQEEYFQEIHAPKKEFFKYENAAHSPMYENYEQTAEILDRIVR